MKNAKITYKITQGMYILTTPGGGCVVDAVSQVSGGEQPIIAVAVMKKNRTNELLHENDRFALSVIGERTDPDNIRVYGFQSSRDTNKFAQSRTEFIAGVPVVSGTLGYMVCEKIDTIENDTHTLFLGRMIEGDVWEEGAPMSYGYYRAHKDDLIKVTTESGKTAWVCQICGYVYYGDELPADYRCPVCGVGADQFVKKQ